MKAVSGPNPLRQGEPALPASLRRRSETADVRAESFRQAYPRQRREYGGSGRTAAVSLEVRDGAIFSGT
ncbi:MAG: hypothetical protein N3A57_06060 [Negativicutes bacterium]|nr:hypothetical protein [Negativicutes bacterium]